MSQQLSVEAMRVITDATGLSLSKNRFQLGDNNALKDVAKTATQLAQDLTRLKPGLLAEVLEDARLRGDTAMRDKILDFLKARKETPTG